MAEGVVNLSPGTITNAHVAAGAAVAADKLQHQYAATYGEAETGRGLAEAHG